MPRGWFGAKAPAGRWAKGLAAGTLAALLLNAPVPAYAEEPPAGDSAAVTTVGTVSLVTGDRVTVARDRDGTHLATLVPGEGGVRGTGKVVRRGADGYVIPLAAESYVAAGVLDR
jgi:hypothetical protein